MSRNVTFWAYVAIMLGVLGHASSEFVAKLTGVFGPELTVWRFILGGSGLVLVALLNPRTRDLWTPLREQPMRILLLSIFGMALAQLIFHWSLEYATVIQVATLVTTMPIWVVIVHAVLTRTAVPAAKIASGIGATVGVILLMTDGYLYQLAEVDSLAFVGVLMAIGCALLGAIYMVMVKPLINQYGAIRMTTFTFALGAIGLWFAVGAAWDIWVNPLTLFDRDPSQYWAIMAMGWWNTTIAMVLWLGGLAAMSDMPRANYVFFLKPVIAALLAYFILNEAVTGIQILAIIVVCACVVIELFWDQISARFSSRPQAA